jgi:hypothetical protein
VSLPGRAGSPRSRGDAAPIPSHSLDLEKGMAGTLMVP